MKWGSVFFKFFKYTFLSFFILLTAFTLVESGLDTQKTILQTEKILSFLYPKQDQKIPLEKIDVSIINQQDIYTKNDTINYKIDFFPANTSFKDVEIESNSINGLNINFAKNTIEILEDGNYELTFRSKEYKNIYDKISFKADTFEIKSLKLNDSKKDLFFKKR